MPGGAKIRRPVPRRSLPLIAALVATTIVVSAVLCVLAWRLIHQQHALDEQRARGQLERSADIVSARVSERLAAAGERLPIRSRHRARNLPWQNGAGARRSPTANP